MSTSSDTRAVRRCVQRSFAVAALAGAAFRRFGMRHARRLSATLIGLAIWSVATTSVAHARPVPDPIARGSLPAVKTATKTATTTLTSGTPLWQFVLVATIAVLVVAAAAGLINALKHSRSSRPSSMLHA